MVRHAFETLNLTAVWLHVYEYNPRGMRAYERVGFKREGILRQANYAKAATGHHHDGDLCARSGRRAGKGD